MNDASSLVGTGNAATPDRILVADDEEIIREMLFSYLTDAGYIVDMAADGHQALALLGSTVPYDIVITDIRMPGPNGMDILRAAKTARQDAEVIVMTAFSTEDMAIEAVRLGAYDYLKKPIDDLGLFALLIRQILLKQSLARENQRLLQDLKHKNNELESANGRLTSMATTDPLTGVHNRRYFLMRLEQQFKQMLRYGDPFGLLMLDLDHFKLINDRYGHQVGDQVLCHFVKTVQGLIRETDLFGRYGGEEFLLLLHGTAARDALMTSERLRQEIQDKPYVSGALTVVFTVSVGLAVVPDCGAPTPSALVKAADTALYRAKADGRNRVVLASPVEELADATLSAEVSA